ncbi:hypothetical protein G7054_g14650 [Neopestalotiopsis clavispora]|nr:hypothetical protein G7054_g14650 [Neopestalotiopsis clavispora]
MPQRSAPPSAIKVTYQNESSFDFKVSESSPPILRGCQIGEEFKLSNISPGSTSKEVLIELEQLADAKDASAFLTFEFGSQKLVVWIHLDPKLKFTDIKAGVFPIDEPLAADVVEKLATGQLRPEEARLGDRLFWLVEDEDGERFAAAILAAQPIEMDGSEPESEPESTFAVQAFVAIQDPVFAEKRPMAPEAHYDDYKLTAGKLPKKGDAVHENMVIAALIDAGVLERGTTYDQILGKWWGVDRPDDWEFIRGVIWNDDPACSLFFDDSSNNGNFGTGVSFGADYKCKFKFLSDNIIYRSHYEDLQFLHSMGCKTGEEPSESKRKIMLWLETMYRLSVSDEVLPENPIGSRLGEFFNDTTTPRGSDSFKRLLMGNTTSYANPKIDRRALGSCFHVIQDSFAVGHCQRRLENPQDLTTITIKRFWNTAKFWEKPIRIKSFPRGKPGRFKEIQNFHAYSGQDEDQHGHYDEIPSGEQLDPSDIGSFDCIVGARDAIEKCSKLAEFWRKGTRWNDGPRQFFNEEVFVTNDATTKSNIDVDESLWKL